MAIPLASIASMIGRGIVSAPRFIAGRVSGAFARKPPAPKPNPPHTWDRVAAREKAAAKAALSTQAPTHTPTRDPLLDNLWKFDTTWNLAQRLADAVDRSTPTFAHAINVSVIGGPAADMRRVWYLACAAAFGRLRHGVKAAAGGREITLDATWDITGKAAMISVGYTMSGWLGQAGDSGNGTNNWKVFGGGFMFASSIAFPPLALAGLALAADGAPDSDAPVDRAGGTKGGIDLIMEGPDQITIGASWPDWFRRKPGVTGLPAGAKTDDGVYASYGYVRPSCTADDKLYRFWNRPTINVLGEMIRTDSNGRRVCPFGQIVAVDVFAPIIGQYGTLKQPFSRRSKFKHYLRSPLLPDDGRLITTGEKRHPDVQPPKPWLDGRSRMSTVDLIFAALHDPCNAPAKVECGVQPSGGTGYHMYAPGTQPEWTPPNNLPETTAAVLPVTPPLADIPRIGK